MFTVKVVDERPETQKELLKYSDLEPGEWFVWDDEHGGQGPRQKINENCWTFTINDTMPRICKGSDYENLTVLRIKVQIVILSD